MFYFGTNMKMYKTITETSEYLKRIVQLYEEKERKDIALFVIPPFTAIDPGSKILEGSPITIGAQNMCWSDQGQFTGEISPCMLEEVGAKLIMVGHSERRNIFGETDEMCAKKVATALRHGFKTLLCVGEDIYDKAHSISIEKLAIQIKVGLSNVQYDQLDKIIIAYEPSWAIGVDGVPAEPEYVNQMHASIKKTIHGLFPQVECIPPVLYGGSINLANAWSYAQQSQIDGLFIGRSAWDADNFFKIIDHVLAEQLTEQTNAF